MKRKLPVLLIILMCFCALTALTSCEYVLDLIFGPGTPSNPSDTDQPSSHVHSMQVKTYEGETCSGQSNITYYTCGGCGKSFLDEEGKNEIADVTALDAGHVYVIKTDGNEHYSECAFCRVEQADSRAEHFSERWLYSPAEHYKLCDVCGAKFENGAHDGTGSCSTCGRQSDYASLCNGNYGYDQLASFDHGADMQKLYNKIDKAAQSVHGNANYNAKKSDGMYALDKINVLDCALTVDEARITVASYCYDKPLYYWIGKQCAVTYQEDNSRPVEQSRAVDVVVSVDGDYALGSRRIAQNEVIYAEIDRYLSAVSRQTDSYQIALGLHDAIIDNIDYARQSDGVTPEEDAWAHNIVGVFAKRSAVCEGYAKAYQLLLNACGVDNIYVVGSSKGMGHAWNLVKLSDNKWYWYDLTWDDQPNAANGKTYDYLCRTDSAFRADHTVSNVKSGMNYFYGLPDVSADEYKSDFLTIGQSVTADNVTYTLIGYDSLAVDKILSPGNNGVVTLPAYVKHNGRTYSVKQINDEALVTLRVNQQGQIVSQVGPQITKLIIPKTVERIYNKSFYYCSTLIAVQFDDPIGWQRYGMTGQSPHYEQISEEALSSELQASAQLKRLHTGSDGGSYYCVWVKNAR